MTSVEAERRARFDVLARQTYAPLRRYLARRADPDLVDDVLAETLLVIWRRLDDVPADAALAWCYGAARRCLANARRAEDRRRRLVLRLVSQPDPRPDPVWAGPGAADAALAEALAGLSDTDRDVLRLWAWEQLEPREIAVALGISANAASIRLHRAVSRLRHRFATRPGSGGKDDGPAGHPVPRQNGPHEETEATR